MVSNTILKRTLQFRKENLRNLESCKERKYLPKCYNLYIFYLFIYCLLTSKDHAWLEEEKGVGRCLTLTMLMVPSLYFLV